MGIGKNNDIGSVAATWGGHVLPTLSAGHLYNDGTDLSWVGALPLAGGTMSGDITMGNNDIAMGTGLIGFDNTASEGLAFDTNGDVTLHKSMFVTEKIIEMVEAHGTVSSGTEDFDLDDGQYHTVTAGGNFTVTFSNWPASGKLTTISLKLINAGAHTITWPGGVDWPGGTEPSWTSSGTDFAVLFTDDGGTIVHGTRSIEDSK